MLRTLSAFVLVFCLLSLIVHQYAAAGLFGIGSAALFFIDVLWSKQAPPDRVPRTRVGSIF
jgi:hypothetical protein